MKKRNNLILAIAIFLLFTTQIMAICYTPDAFTTLRLKNGVIISSESMNIPEWKKDYIEDRTVLTYYNPDEVFDGYTLFNCDWNRRGNQSNIIMDMNANIVAGFEGIGGGPELINSTTIMNTNKTHVIFWNIVTNNIEYVQIPEGIDQHHDLEYNAKTDQFLYLGHETNGTVEVEGEQLGIIHDTITLADRQGNILWHWRTYDHIPFNQTHYWLYNFTNPRSSGADWTHGNTVFWDLEEENIVYYNARHLHTFYKIDMNTGKIIWALGAYNSNFTLYDKQGNEKISLFYGAHAVEKIGPDKFIIYDNDYYNITDLSSHTPRLVVFQIDEDEWIAKELWSWEVPDNDLYIGDHWGDADFLPDGTYIGTFGAGGSTDNDYITEVNADGDIVWEIAINGTDTYRVERFYLSPVLLLPATDFEISNKENLNFNVTVWNSFRERRKSPGTFDVLNGDELLQSTDFYFGAYWQPVNVTVDLTADALDLGSYNLTIIVTNEDGISTSLIFQTEVQKANALSIFLTGLTLIATASVSLYKRQIKK